MVCDDLQQWMGQWRVKRKAALDHHAVPALSTVLAHCAAEVEVDAVAAAVVSACFSDDIYEPIACSSLLFYSGSRTEHSLLASVRQKNGRRKPGFNCLSCFFVTGKQKRPSQEAHTVKSP